MLDPLCFLLFVNDIGQISSYSMTTPCYLVWCITSTIQSVCNPIWTKYLNGKVVANGLQRPVKVLRSTSFQKYESFNPSLHPMLGQTQQSADYQPYLGVTLWENLDRRTHILNIRNKTNFALGFVKRIFHRCPQKVKIKLTNHRWDQRWNMVVPYEIRIGHIRNHGLTGPAQGSTPCTKSLREWEGMRNQCPKATKLANSRKKKTSSYTDADVQMCYQTTRPLLIFPAMYNISPP